MPCDRHNEIMLCYFCGRVESQSHDQKPDRITNLANQVEDLRSMIVDMLERVGNLEGQLNSQAYCVTTCCGKTTVTVHAMNCACTM
jgi:hypothetical protein